MLQWNQINQEQILADGELVSLYVGLLYLSWHFIFVNYQIFWSKTWYCLRFSLQIFGCHNLIFMSFNMLIDCLRHDLAFLPLSWLVQQYCHCYLLQQLLIRWDFLRSMLHSNCLLLLLEAANFDAKGLECFTSGHLRFINEFEPRPSLHLFQL